MPVETFTLQNIALSGGACVPELKLVYACFGELNAGRDNAILFPTYYTGTHEDNQRLIGPGRALDTDKHFIVVPNMFGNSVSSSPSNTPAPFDGPRFPTLSIYDNVAAQAKLANALGIDQWSLVLGWSMGGIQTYQWAAQCPNRVKRALIICGSARAAEHNQVFLDGVKTALTTDAHFNGGDYREQPEAGLKAFARVYAGWAYSQAFFRKQRYKDMGFAHYQDLLTDWENDHLNWDANDLLAMLNTWEHANIADQAAYRSNIVSALNAIEAETWLMPCEQDLYFRYEDSKEELKHLKRGKYLGFTSDFGHCAGGPGRFARETDIIENAIRALLKTDV